MEFPQKAKGVAINCFVVNVVKKLKINQKAFVERLQVFEYERGIKNYFELSQSKSW